MLLDITLSQLQAFLAVSSHGGFRAAAGTLNMSQPALSRTIRLAEDTLGTQLFHRDTRGATLTASGHRLLPIAERIIAEFDASRGELAEFLSGRTGRVTLAVLPSVGVSVIPDAVAGFLRDYPKVKFNIQGLSAGPLQEAVSDGRVDFGISVPPSAGSGLAFEPLLTDRFVLLCRRDDPLTRLDCVPWAAFAERPFIASAISSSIRMMTDATFSQLGLAVEPLYESGHVSINAALVAAGLGITALPLLSLKLIDRANLVSRPLDNPTVERQIGLVTRPKRALSAAAEQLRTSFLAAPFDETS